MHCWQTCPSTEYSHKMHACWSMLKAFAVVHVGITFRMNILVCWHINIRHRHHPNPCTLEGEIMRRPSKVGPEQFLWQKKSTDASDRPPDGEREREREGMGQMLNSSQLISLNLRPPWTVCTVCSRETRFFSLPSVCPSTADLISRPPPRQEVCERVCLGVDRESKHSSNI